ncbi:MAG: exodeoxyribonuclease VII large subunit [Clostridia bacterium]|nr:exodeoxyribonuclease VII large subunit [Clostridia bacterium]
MIGINILTVTQLNTYVKAILDGEKKLWDVFLLGEISNLTNHYQSGHLYFSLKDEKSTIRAVMFFFSAKNLKFTPKNGMSVIVRGKVSLYENSGNYQIYVEDMQPDGLGSLNLAFEQLKEKLANEGLFDPTLKKPLPRYPQRVGLITAKTGAALFDVLSILKRRCPLIEVLFYPVMVQGTKAAEQIIEAIKFFNLQKNEKSRADVLIVTRGGGSIEDLWCFNDESLAREIFKSKIPIISAVGHETDFTICDFVADLRAPTPSAAAEVVSPEMNETILKIDTYVLRMKRKIIDEIKKYQKEVAAFASRNKLKEQIRWINKKKMILQLSVNKLESNFLRILNKKKEAYLLSVSRLDNLSPLKILSLGYSLAISEDGNVINSITKVNKNDEITIKLKDGQLRCSVNKKIKK